MRLGSRLNLNLTKLIGLSFLAWTVLLTNSSEALAYTECKLSTRSTCNGSSCEVEKMNFEIIARFDAYGSSVELCGGFEKKSSDCESSNVIWEDQVPRLAMIRKFDDKGVRTNGSILSYDPLLSPNVAWIITPLWGGVGNFSGHCEQKEKKSG